MVRRVKEPVGDFPDESHPRTDCIDAVEHRLYAVIAQADGSAASGRLREDHPRFGFASALIAVVVIATLVVLAGGPLR